MKSKIFVVVLAISIIAIAKSVNADYVRDAAQRVKAADWSKMETVTVFMSEFSFSPSELIFKERVPYKLEIINKGTTKHYFTATDFFESIATRKVQSNTDGEIKAPYFLALEVFPGRQLDLYFIPVKKGNYNLKCTIAGHAEKGMVSQIKIE